MSLKKLQQGEICHNCLLPPLSHAHNFTLCWLPGVMKEVTMLLSQCSSSICPLGPIPSYLRKDVTTVIWYFPSESPLFLLLLDHFPSAFKSADIILTEKDRSLFWPNYFLRTHISILWEILFPFSLLQNIEQISLCCTVGPCWLSVLNTAVCTCQSQIS